MELFASVSCSTANQETISYETIRALNIQPEAIYAKTEHIVSLARCAGQKSAAPIALLPFCHTVEAHAMGADIKPADETAGPRPGNYVMQSPAEVKHTVIAGDADAKRLLEACATLKAEGLPVVFQLSGPISILSCLMDLSKVFKLWRKEPDTVQACLDTIRDMLCEFVKEIVSAGAECISYADPAASPDILGPKYSALLTECFTVPLLREMIDICGTACTISVCPLTGAALSRAGQIKMTPRGEGGFAVSCIKRSGYPVQKQFALCEA